MSACEHRLWEKYIGACTNGWCVGVNNTPCCGECGKCLNCGTVRRGFKPYKNTKAEDSAISKTEEKL